MRTLQQLKQKNSSVFDKKVIEFKDLIESTTYEYEIVGAEVGDSKQTAFYPQVKMKKWDNECNFSLRFNYPIAGSVEKLSNTIYWKSDDEKVEAVFYDIAPYRSIYYVYGGFEFEVIFNEKPISNKVEFSIQSKNLNFHKQTKLDDPNTSCKSFIIDSYAVYHSSKKHNKYTTGKAFQIYRSFVYDSNGRKEYCDMNIEEDILTITIPQDFIDNAVYPIHLDPTIGNTNIGAYKQIFWYGGAIGVSTGTPVGINPQAEKISAFACWQTLWTKNDNSSIGFENETNMNCRMALWNKSTGKLIAMTFAYNDNDYDEWFIPGNIYPYRTYDLISSNGYFSQEIYSQRLEPHNVPDYGSSYPANYEKSGGENESYWGYFGFEAPQNWFTQIIVPCDMSTDPFGERSRIPIEDQLTSDYRQWWLNPEPVPIDNIEYYIGCVFLNKNQQEQISQSTPDGLPEYQNGLKYTSEAHQGFVNIIMFDIVPGAGGCEPGDTVGPQGGSMNPTLYSNASTYGMFEFTWDLKNVPLGNGKWDDRNYSVYLDYISSSSVSSSSSSSSTSSSSSSSHSFTIKTMGENTSDDYNNVIEDTYLRQDLNTRNYGKSASLAINGINVNDDKNILIKIDYTPLPVGANILSAILYIKTGYLGQGADNRDFISIYKMLTNWNEGDEDNYPPSTGSVDPTWSHRLYNATVWNTAGANGAGTDHEAIEADNIYIALKEVLSQEQWYSFDITSEVIEQIAGSNFGFILTGSGDGIGGDIPVTSSDGEDGSRPYLYIEFT